MSIFVLVHGAWHGKWCWDKVAPLLEAAGHRVEAFDLPGHGEDRTPLRDVTLAAYTERVCQVLDKQPEPVILVGHSMGGLAISQAAEARPAKIRTLVYLSAFLLQDGESWPQVSQRDPKTLVLPNAIPNATSTYLTFPQEKLKEAFYADCSDEDIARATALLTPQAIGPIKTAVRVTPERFGQVPRVYISCLRDRAATPLLQQIMYNANPCQSVLFLDSSHSPFFSMPVALVQHLLAL